MGIIESKVIELYAKLYRLMLYTRASDHIYGMDDEMTLKSRHAQNIACHAFFVARLTEIVGRAYNSMLSEANERPDLLLAHFMATHHDDGEYRKGDAVPAISYLMTQQEKKQEEDIAIGELTAGSFVSCSTYCEYEARNTSSARLVKLCDFLELMLHSYILRSFGYGIVSPDDYFRLHPAAHAEAKAALECSGGDPVAFADIMEATSRERLKKMDFSPVYLQIYERIIAEAKTFPFKKIVATDS